MNIDDVIQLYENENNPIVKQIALIINDWKLSDNDIDDLVFVIEKYFGNTWIEDEKEYKKNYRIWTDFKNTEIVSLPGMTMNERLWIFGLIDRFDQLKSDAEKAIIYKKLKAKI